VLPYRRSRNFFWIVLLPLSWIWAFVSSARRKYSGTGYRSKLKIICVGNIHSGGSGKTPLVVAIAQYFSSKKPAVLARGYRGRMSKKGALVSLDVLNGVDLYGDEPWMLAKRFGLEVFVGSDRTRMLREIEYRGNHSLVVMDDGFQHFRVQRDVDLVAINTRKTTSEAFCLPLGELREPLSALTRATALLLVDDGTAGERQAWENLSRSICPTVPQFVISPKVDGFWEGEEKVELAADTSWLAFCGLGEPISFEEMSNKITGCRFLRAFPDHYQYEETDIAWLVAERERSKATGFVTTDKDFPKVASRLAARGQRVVSIRISYDISDEFWYFLKKRLE
jgi:tetraacyldisaccharide 4'-kinase